MTNVAFLFEALTTPLKEVRGQHHLSRGNLRTDACETGALFQGTVHSGLLFSLQPLTGVQRSVISRGHFHMFVLFLMSVPEAYVPTGMWQKKGVRTLWPRNTPLPPAVFQGF